MGTEIQDIVDVQITRETATITRVGFGTATIVGIHSKFAEDFKTYNNIEAVAEDFETTDEEYKAAAKYFSQALKPEKVIIGKRASNVALQDLVTVSTVENDTTYTVTINGTPFTFLSDADATDLEIADGLVTAINLGSEPVTATDNVDGTFDLDEDVAGATSTIAVDTNLTKTNVIPNVNIATELARLTGLGMTDWYFLILTRRTTEAEQLQDIEETAAYIEAISTPKIYFYAIDQASMLTAVSTDIGSILAALNYDRTVGFYSTDEANYPEAAWIGGQAPKDAGSLTWKFKELIGITADILSSNDITNLKAKSLNFYEEIAGASVISSEAVVAGGEFIDVIRGSDKLSTRIGERIFTIMINTDKIPYTIQGLGVIEDAIRAEIGISIGENFLVSGSEVVTLPDIDSIDSADKAARLLQDVTFSAQLAGAIHKVIIRGTLTL